jgi:hypothetical protein
MSAWITTERPYRDAAGVVRQACMADLGSARACVLVACRRYGVRPTSRVGPYKGSESTRGRTYKLSRSPCTFATGY